MASPYRPSAPPMPESSYGSDRPSLYHQQPPPPSAGQSSSYGQAAPSSSAYGYGYHNPQYGYGQNPYGSPSPYHHQDQLAPPPSTTQYSSHGQAAPPSSSPYGLGQHNPQYGHDQNPYGYGHNSYDGQPLQQTSFPLGTDPEVIRVFQMVDMDRSGFIDEKELQQALSSGYQKFSIRTIRLLLFLFRKNHDSADKIGPTGFAALWSCLGEWRSIFERFDRDRSGRMDATELREAFRSIGYAVPPSVLQLLASSYDDGSGRKVDLNFDSFVECGMIIKGLTEKFKEKDTRYTGSATLTYDTFMSMVLPFLVRYD